MKNKNMVYDSKDIYIHTTDHDFYDFIAVIHNKTNKDISIYFEEEYESLERIRVLANDWTGLLDNKESKLILKAIKARKFHYMKAI